MKSLIAVKFCTFLLIGTSLGQKETQQPGVSQIRVTKVTIQGSNPDNNTEEGLVQQVVHLIVDPTVNLATKVGEVVVNVSNAVEQTIVEAGKEVIHVGTDLGEYVANVTTETLGYNDAENKEKSENIISDKNIPTTRQAQDIR